jgi:hypothetical protein
MPNLPWSGRQGASGEDAVLAALLAGTELPEDLAAGLQPAADLVAALRARPSGDELAGEAAAMAEYRDRVGVSHPARPTRRRRLTSLMSAKVAIGAAAVAITIGGVASAAYAGALPAPAQRIAHDFIGAPAVHRDANGTKPSAGGARPAIPAACRAYGRALAHGTAAQQAAALKKLVSAAGGANKIAAYCQLARHRRHHYGWGGCWTSWPNSSWSPKSWPSGTPSAQPTATPSPNPTLTPGPTPSPSCTPFPHPSGSPRPHPSWSPATHPSSHPGGRFGRHHHGHGRRVGHHGGKPRPRPSATPSTSPIPSPSPQP